MLYEGSVSPQIQPAPPPWTLKGTVYLFMLYISSKNAARLQADPSFIYSPLEASAPFAEGRAVGGLGVIQVIRYTESPVGPYDELLMIPGRFEREAGVKGNNAPEMKRNMRCTRIYVSQEKTCWNGRNNWNIPKHLAKFDFKLAASGGVEISVFPHEADSQGIESNVSKEPFFKAVYKNIPYLPSFPLSISGPSKAVGLDLSLVQPPLPEGKGVYGEVVGTDRWCRIDPQQWSPRTSLGWWDLQMKAQEEAAGEATEGDTLLGEPRFEDTREGVEREMAKERTRNWWPGAGRWRIGMVMEDATIVFPEGTHWNDSRL